jgi:hypothetical protein
MGAPFGTPITLNLWVEIEVLSDFCPAGLTRRLRAGLTPRQKSMPPMSPPGIAGASFSGLSATTASVVRNSAAMEAAF